MLGWLHILQRSARAAHMATRGGCGTTAVGARQHVSCRTVPFQVKLHHRVDMPRRLALCTYLAGGAVARQHSQKRKTMGGGTPATPATSGQEVPRMDPLPPPSAGAAGDALLGVADVDIDGGERMEVAAAAVEAVEAAPAPAVEVAAAEVAAAVAAAGGGAAGGGAAGGAGASSEDDGLTYELFSVLVHAGTANAGHYYAYIKVALTLTMTFTLTLTLTLTLPLILTLTSTLTLTLTSTTPTSRTLRRSAGSSSTTVASRRSRQTAGLGRRRRLRSATPHCPGLPGQAIRAACCATHPG